MGHCWVLLGRGGGGAETWWDLHWTEDDDIAEVSVGRHPDNNDNNDDNNNNDNDNDNNNNNGSFVLRRWQPHDEERHAAYYYASQWGLTYYVALIAVLNFDYLGGVFTLKKGG